MRLRRRDELLLGYGYGLTTAEHERYTRRVEHIHRVLQRLKTLHRAAPPEQKTVYARLISDYINEQRVVVDNWKLARPFPRGRHRRATG